MRKIFILFVFFFLTACAAWASPPTSIDIAYDVKTKSITATIYHQSYNVKKHYINVVKMSINGVLIDTERFNWQHTAKEQTAVFSIPDVKPGDTILIEAFCNKGGKRAQDIKIK